jgi:hypothetical protein
MEVEGYLPLNPVLPNGEEVNVLMAQPTNVTNLIWLMTNYGPLQYNILTKEIFPTSQIVEGRSLYYASMARINNDLLFADRFTLLSIPLEGFANRFRQPSSNIYQYDVAVNNSVERRIRLNTSEPIILAENEQLVRLFVSDGSVFSEGQQFSEIMYANNAEYTRLNHNLIFDVADTPFGLSELKVKSHSFVGKPSLTRLLVKRDVPFYKLPVVTYTSIAIVVFLLVVLTLGLVRKYRQASLLTKRLSTISECFDSASEALVGVNPEGQIYSWLTTQYLRLILPKTLRPITTFRKRFVAPSRAVNGKERLRMQNQGQ